MQNEPPIAFEEQRAVRFLFCTVSDNEAPHLIPDPCLSPAILSGSQHRQTIRNEEIRLCCLFAMSGGQSRSLAAATNRRKQTAHRHLLDILQSHESFFEAADASYPFLFAIHPHNTTGRAVGCTTGTLLRIGMIDRIKYCKLSWLLF